MINRSSIPNRWIALLLAVLLAIPLLGWNALLKLVSRGAIQDSGTFTNVTTQSVSAQAASAENIETGQKLFMGNLHFQNDGPPCMGCHNVGSNGVLGGGALGPDLTDVTTRRSESELEAILSNSGAVSVPVMQPIYAEHPLTTEEQADLLAFMHASVGQPESDKELLVISISLAGFVIAVVAIGVLYRGRLRGVRRSLLQKTQAEKR